MKKVIIAFWLILIIGLAGFFIVLDMATSGWPRCNDLRIVQSPHGYYEIEYYYDFPAWHKQRERYDTLEQAQKMIKIMESNDQIQPSK